MNSRRPRPKLICTAGTLFRAAAKIGAGSFLCAIAEHLNEISRFPHQLPDRRSHGLAFSRVEAIPVIAIALASRTAGTSATAVHAASGATTNGRHRTFGTAATHNSSG